MGLDLQASAGEATSRDSGLTEGPAGRGQQALTLPLHKPVRSAAERIRQLGRAGLSHVLLPSRLWSPRLHQMPTTLTSRAGRRTGIRAQLRATC